MAINHILSARTSPTFTVIEIKVSGPEHWSQVYYGRLEGHDEVLCLEVFDERNFPTPAKNDVGPVGCREWERLAYLNLSEDLVRREETVYDRLQESQGYGFHLVCLPRVPTANGLPLFRSLLHLMGGSLMEC